MMSCTLFLWMRVPAVTERYKTALIISGMVTFIAAYHYIRIFNSWVEAYAYPMGAHGFLDEDHTFHRYPGDYHHVAMGYHNPGNPKLTGTPFNDAYRYMDHLVGTYMPVEEWKPLVREREIKEVEGALAGSAM